MISSPKISLSIASLAILCSAAAAQLPYQAPHGISPGSIAGIVIGSFLGVVIVIVALLVACTWTPKPMMNSKRSKKTGASWQTASVNELATLPATSEHNAQEMAEIRLGATDPPSEESSTPPPAQRPRRKKKRPAQ